jgi:hypothetical protein
MGRKELKHLVQRVCKTPRSWKGGLVWSRSSVCSKCNLTEESVAKVLQSIDPANPFDVKSYLKEDAIISPQHPPVQESVMLALFKGLYKATGIALDGKSGDRITDDLLGKQGYWAEFQLDEDARRTLKETADLLRCLDASVQRREFNLAIGERKDFIAGVATPCVWSQQWLIDCLINTPEYLKNLLSVKIQVEGCFEMEDLTKAIMEGLHCKSEDDLWRKLREANRPLIISLYNFGRSSAVTPQEVVQGFWVPLQEKLNDRKASSQIILLMADYNLSGESMEGVKPLTSLSSISEDDVKEWMVRKMGNSHCVNTFLTEGFPPKEWRWGEPGTILNRVCQDLLGLKGLMDLHTTWRRS